MIKKPLIPFILLSFFLMGCSATKPENSLTPSSVDYTQQTDANQPNIRQEIKANIDRLKDYDIVNIKHMTKGIEDPKIYEPETPKEFNAGMFNVTFQRFRKGEDSQVSSDIVSVVCQTESKVGHLAKVVPGKTVVDGFIFYAGNANVEDIPNLINENLKFTKDEEKYFIDQLYSHFAKPMTLSQANFVNKTKDVALAIYFNGEGGIDEFHTKQIDNFEFSKLR